MCGKTFGFCERNRGRSDLHQGLPIKLLNRRHADEVGGAQAAACRGGAAGWQHVIRAGHVVAASLRAQRADEDGAGTGQAAGRRGAVAHDVFGCQALRQRDRTVEGLRHDDAAVVTKRGRRRAGRGQLAVDLFRNRQRQAHHRREQDRPGIRIVLGLGDQIGGNPRRVASRGDHRNLARSGEEIDGAVRGDLCLRGRHIGIPRSDDLVDRRNRFGAVGERRDGMSAADAEQPADPRLERRAHHRRIGPRAHREDFADPGGHGGNRGHQERRRERIAAARHVAADTIERSDPLGDAQARGR